MIPEAGSMHGIARLGLKFPHLKHKPGLTCRMRSPS